MANAVARKLFEKNIGNYVLDGDNIRHGLNKDLGFSESDRMEKYKKDWRSGEAICRSVLLFLRRLFHRFESTENK